MSPTNKATWSPSTGIATDRRFRSAVERVAHTSGASVLLLRAFLAVTFTFAGLQKLANPNFFNAKAAGSFQAQLQGAMLTSPIRSVLGAVNHAPVLIATLIACGEVAVGVGTALGLFSRIAALGGMLLSLSFFLTISYTASPYYYGADIVFVFAWTPILLGGSEIFSVDAFLQRRSHEELTARTDQSPTGAIDRRTALRQAGALGLASLLVGTIIGTVTGIGRSINHSNNSSATEPTTTPTSSPSSERKQKIAAASDIKVGEAHAFTDSSQAIPAFVVHPSTDTFVAFSAVCTHAGCTVAYVASNEQFACPCHGSVFDAKTGAVIQGPATRPLPSIAITESNGEIFTTD